MISKKQLLYIRDDIINSIDNSGCKQRLTDLFRSLEMGRVRAKYVVNRLEYYGRMGYTSINTKKKIMDLYNQKMYFEKNKDEYGDLDENKICNTNT